MDVMNPRNVNQNFDNEYRYRISKRYHFEHV